MTTPSEGPGPSDPQRDAFRDRLIQEQLSPDQARAMLLDFYDMHQESQRRIAALEQQAAGARTRGLATTVAAAGTAAAAMSDQGQALIGRAAEGVAWAGREGLRLGQEGVRLAGEGLNSLSGWAVEAWNDKIEPTIAAAVQGGQEFWAEHGAQITHDSAVAATGAVIGAAVMASRNENVRQAVAQRANAVNRWGREAIARGTEFARNAPGAVARGVGAAAGQVGRGVGSAASTAGERIASSRAGELTRNATQGLKRLYQQVRNDPRVDYVVTQVAQLTGRQTHALGNELGNESKLPKSPDAVAAAMAQDPARPAPSTAVRVEGSATEATGAATNAGEAARTNPTERSKGGGPSMG